MSGAAKHKQNQINKNAWWAREDSNLQPSGYERATFTAITSKYWHFRAGSATNVRVWLRRFIGYLLVGREAGSDHGGCLLVAWQAQILCARLHHRKGAWKLPGRCSTNAL